MRLRQLVLACGLSSFVLSPYVSALGLGEVKLKSSLNQPLEAEVKLLDTRDLTAEQILVTLASPADFERNGVDRLYFYTELQFQVDLDAADGPKVIIRSRNPVREPYLNFLIEARWTAGRLLREYTLLMDLPTFEEDARPSSVVAPSASAAPATRQPVTASTPRTTPAPSASAATPRRSTTATTAPLSTDDYEVRANDTLWEIAMRARPDSSVSVHQSMMALYRANPEAFINGNINKLRRGQVLRIPDASEMTSIGKTEAVAQFAQSTSDSSYGAQLNASRRATTVSSESSEVSGRVKLAAPTSGSAAAGQGSGANDGKGRALEQELAATLEELDKTKSENSELGARVKDLEAQIETMERLVAVSNEKLRALQVAAEQGASDNTPTPTASTVAAAAPEAAAAVASVEAASSAAAQPPMPTPPKPKPVVQQPVAQASAFDTLKDNSVWLALAALGVLGAGAAAYAHRRRKQAEQQDAEQQEEFAMDDSIDDNEQQEFDALTEAQEDPVANLFDEEGDDAKSKAVAETGDVVGEADIYIAYGKLDQAEEMLVNALEKDPQSTDIRMKLLEVYAQQQNVSGFDKHYALLLPIAGAALISRASELRETIPDAGAFSADALAASPESSADDFEFESFDLDAVDEKADEQAAQAESDFSSNNLASEDFNFDLDLDDDASTISSLSSTSSTEQASVNQNSDSDLDFDFDLSDFESDSSAKAVDANEGMSFALDNNEDHDNTSAEQDDEFSFELDDDSDTPVVAQGDLAALESLDVLGDDFNLDMDVDGVDLAALDHEMESLDADFELESLEDDEPQISEFIAAEIAKDEAEPGLDLDDEIAPLHSADDDFTFLAEDLGSTKLVLTDDLDKVDDLNLEADVNFEADEDLLLASQNDSIEEASDTDTDDSFNLESLDDEFAALESSMNEPEATTDELLVDSPEQVVDLELHDEIPALQHDDEELSNSALTAQDFLDSELSSDADEFSAELLSDAEPSTASAIGNTLSEVHEDELFAQALSDFDADAEELDLSSFSSDEAALADLSDDDMDSELDFLADADEAATKLDLARAYIDMGDTDGAKDILSEVVNEGNEEQRNEANELLGRIV